MYQTIEILRHLLKKSLFTSSLDSDKTVQTMIRHLICYSSSDHVSFGSIFRHIREIQKCVAVAKTLV